MEAGFFETPAIYQVDRSLDPVCDDLDGEYLDLDGGYYDVGDQGASELDEPYLIAYARWLLGELDWLVTVWMASHAIRMLQVSLGVIFLWFGALKLVPGLSPAEDLVVATAQALLTVAGISLPMGLVVFLLAAWEVTLGVGFLLGRYLRVMVWMLLAHMCGTALPLVLLPDLVWTHFPYALTLEGQYIIKNLVIVSGAAAIGATLHGGYLTWRTPAAETDQAGAGDRWDGPPAETPPAVADGYHQGAVDELSGEPEPSAPRVWIVDEDGSLVATYELDDYSRDYRFSSN